jgi:hypothetical protein
LIHSWLLLLGLMADARRPKPRIKIKSPAPLCEDPFRHGAERISCAADGQVRSTPETRSLQLFPDGSTS